MSFTTFGINNNPCAFLELRYKFPTAIEALRSDFPGNQIELSNNGSLIVYPERKRVIPDIQRKQYAVNQYSAGLARLIQPWGNLISEEKRDKLSEEISRFSIGSYEEPKYIAPTTDDEYVQLLKNILVAFNKEVEINERRTKEKKKTEGEELPDNFAQSYSLDPRIKEMLEEKADHRRASTEEIKMKEHLDQITFAALLQNADPAYILAMLAADGFGFKHKDDDVRMGTMYLIQFLAFSILKKTESELKLLPYRVIGLSEREQKREIIREANSLLSAVARYLNSPYCGTKDRNKKISETAIRIESSVIDSGIQLKRILNAA